APCRYWRNLEREPCRRRRKACRLPSAFRLPGLGRLGLRPSLAQLDDRATGRADLLHGALAELVSVHGELLGELPFTQDLDQHVGPLHEASLPQLGLVDRSTRIEAVERCHVDRHDLRRKGHAEAPLGQTTLNRRLATLEVQLADVAAVPGLLTLDTAAARLTDAAARTTTHAPHALPSAGS